MSLINQMLQDLDARRAAHGIGAKLHNDVRPLPKAQAARWPLVFAVMVMVLAAGLGYLAYSGGLGQLSAWFASQPEPSVVTVANQPAETTPALPTPSWPDTALTSDRVQPVSGAGLSLEGVDVSLRLAEAIDPDAAVPAVTVPDPVEPIKPIASNPTLTPSPEAVSIALQNAVQKSAGKPAPGKSSQPALPPVPAPKEKQAAQVTLPSAEVDSDATQKPAALPVIERTAALSSPRERAELEYRKAITAADQGHVLDAETRLSEVLRLDDLHAAARQMLVKLRLDRGKADDAMSLLQAGLVGQPGQLGWAMSLARLQVDRGDLAGAWKTLDYSLPAAARNADYLGFAANVLQRLGRTRDAADQYRRAASVSPGDGRWWLGLGLMQEAQGQSTEAREAFTRARACGNLGPDLLALIEQRLR